MEDGKIILTNLSALQKTAAGLAGLGPALFMLIGMPASRRRGWLFCRRP
jgi:hypothetical protein